MSQKHETEAGNRAQTTLTLSVEATSFFASRSTIEVVGETCAPDAVIDKYQQLSPDVLVLEVRLGGKVTGLDVAKEVLAKFPRAKIVFLSQFDQDNLIKEAYRLGGRAFVTKGSDPALLATAIKRAHEGHLYFLPQVAERLAHLLVQGDMSPQSRLGERDVGVFTLMAQGLTNVEIADKLSLSPKTISNISQSVKEKLGVHRAADITRMAIRYGLIEP